MIPKEITGQMASKLSIDRFPYATRRTIGTYIRRPGACVGWFHQQTERVKSPLLFPLTDHKKGDSPHSRQPSEPTSTQSPGSSKIFEKKNSQEALSVCECSQALIRTSSVDSAQSQQPGSSVCRHRERQGCEVSVRRLVSWQALKISRFRV